MPVIVLEHGDGGQDSDDHGDAGAELVEAVDHGAGGEPQADDDQAAMTMTGTRLIRMRPMSIL